MRWLRFSFLILLAALIQASTLPEMVALTRSGAHPDFLLILLVFFALYCYGYEVVITCFAIGFAADVANSVLGPYLLAFGICGVLLSGLRQFIAVRRTFHIIGVVVVITFVTELFAHMIGFLKGQGWQSGGFSFLFGSAIYSGLLAPYIFSALLAIIDWLGVKKYHFTR
jgi:rod shape-determining protein MreD